eukprot:jgi/Tetstr1/423407/TSEL_014088.t1
MGRPPKRAKAAAAGDAAAAAAGDGPGVVRDDTARALALLAAAQAEDAARQAAAGCGCTAAAKPGAEPFGRAKRGRADAATDAESDGEGEGEDEQPRTLAAMFDELLHRYGHDYMGRKWKECLSRGRNVAGVRPRRSWVPRASLQLSALMLRYPFAAGLAAGETWKLALPPRRRGEQGQELEASSRAEYFKALGEMMCRQGCADLCAGCEIVGSLSAGAVERFFEYARAVFIAGEAVIAGLPIGEAGLPGVLFREPIGSLEAAAHRWFQLVEGNYNSRAYNGELRAQWASLVRDYLLAAADDAWAATSHEHEELIHLLLWLQAYSVHQETAVMAHAPLFGPSAAAARPGMRRLMQESLLEAAGAGDARSAAPARAALRAAMLRSIQQQASEPDSLASQRLEKAQRSVVLMAQLGTAALAPAPGPPASPEGRGGRVAGGEGGGGERGGGELAALLQLLEQDRAERRRERKAWTKCLRQEVDAWRRERQEMRAEFAAELRRWEGAVEELVKRAREGRAGR